MGKSLFEILFRNLLFGDDEPLRLFGFDEGYDLWYDFLVIKGPPRLIGVESLFGNDIES